MNPEHNSIALVEALGFEVLLTTRTTPVTEIHFNGPFHLLFDNGDVVTATSIDSDYDGIRSTHRVVLWGHPDVDGKVGFRAIIDDAAQTATDGRVNP